VKPYALHDVDAVLDYGFDWSEWLADDESISASTWSPPAGIECTLSAIDGTKTLVRVGVSDPALLGQLVKIVNHVTSSDGQEDDYTLALFIGSR